MDLNRVQEVFKRFTAIKEDFMACEFKKLLSKNFELVQTPVDRIVDCKSSTLSVMFSVGEVEEDRRYGYFAALESSLLSSSVSHICSYLIANFFGHNFDLVVVCFPYYIITLREEFFHQHRALKWAPSVW